MGLALLAILGPRARRRGESYPRQNILGHRAGLLNIACSARGTTFEETLAAPAWSFARHFSPFFALDRENRTR
jgi:hypothetical protein